MFLFNPELKRAYFGKGKTGTTTVYSHLNLSSVDPKQSVDGWHMDHNWEYLHRALSPEFNNYRMTCLVRDPFDRWVSGIIEILSIQYNKLGYRPDWLLSSEENFTETFNAVLDFTHMGTDFSFNQNFHTAPFMWEVYLLLYTQNVDILLTENIDQHFEKVWNKQCVNVNPTKKSDKQLVVDAMKNHELYQDILDYLLFDRELYDLLVDHSRINSDYTLDIDTESLRKCERVKALFMDNSIKHNGLNRDLISAMFKTIALK